MQTAAYDIWEASSAAIERTCALVDRPVENSCAPCVCKQSFPARRRKRAADDFAPSVSALEHVDIATPLTPVSTSSGLSPRADDSELGYAASELGILSLNGRISESMAKDAWGDPFIDVLRMATSPSCLVLSFNTERDSLAALMTHKDAACVLTAFAVRIRYPPCVRTQMYLAVPKPWLPGPPEQARHGQAFMNSM